ncbi:MAG: hypothetical protein A3D31_13430 [Candidatus Fluviicola riflensis]|nr:MAG: hypothetical protein CHH17_17865 [Candidatus Fluviicola riflensis]OGS77980.1 MAG: hypothetical protein A3D31_13430 [Candidatus Fluviicola riflensis]OGS85045.1 MAG: hypothetical protein A2724_10365 [Fluviicola sp. RIFCSPHIGHO2_01_FULL_43_53]OGS89317.1 MAG: hypothetical protein A3E30_04670 [Fluviicola sp. RIFCSPHIGHO2_12_FULL_43_24]
MTRAEVENYLEEIESKLLFESERLKISLNRDWANSFPNESSVYLFRENDEICYVGETGSLKGRMNDILNTKNHTIRRNFGNTHFCEFESYEKPSSKKGFCEEIEILLNEKIELNLTMSYIVLSLGRTELEEKLVDKYQPKYNIKRKRGTGKNYTKSGKQLLKENAYEKWTIEDDEKLETLFCEGKKVTELSEIFKRNDGAIRSRIKKLELKEKY